jgi:Ca-activated chloride channel family protein
MLTEVEITGSALASPHGHAPEHIPDVFAGAPLVAALALRPEGGELVVRGRIASGRWEERIRVPSHRQGQGNGALAALYARERVADLEVRAASARNAAKIDREIEELGVRYQIATRLTSWLAIDLDSHVRGPIRHEDMPQELPFGTSMQAFGLRASSAAPAMFDLEEATGSYGAYQASVDPASFKQRISTVAHPSRPRATMMAGMAPPKAGGAPQPSQPSAFSITSSRSPSPPAPSVMPQAFELDASASITRSKKRSPALSLFLVLLLIAALIALTWWVVL